jgi:uncharacterized protein with PQ loop repeat
LPPPPHLRYAPTDEFATNAVVAQRNVLTTSQFINQLISERRPIDTIGVSVAAKLIETIGLSVFLTWWGTRTNPFD